MHHAVTTGARRPIAVIPPATSAKTSRAPVLAAKSSLAAPSWQVIYDRQRTPVGARSKVSFPGRRVAPLRSKRAAPARAEAMDVDSDSSSDDAGGALSYIQAAQFVKAAKKNPKPELASDVEEISDSGESDGRNSLFSASPSPAVVEISSDSEDDLYASTSEEEEDENGLFLIAAPTDRLLDAMGKLALGTPRLSPNRKLPFLRRNVRRGFLLACRRRRVPCLDAELANAPEYDVIYEYQIKTGVEYQARRRVKGYECPLCDLQANFASRPTCEAHLRWDHPEVKVTITENGSRRKVIIVVPYHGQEALARARRAMSHFPSVKKEEQIEESVPPEDLPDEIATPRAPAQPSHSPVRSPERYLVNAPLHVAEGSKQRAGSTGAAPPSPSAPFIRPPIPIRAPTPIRAREPTQPPRSPTVGPSVPASPTPSPPPEIPRRRGRGLVVPSPTASPPPRVSPAPAPAVPPTEPTYRLPLTPPPIERRLGPSLSPTSPTFFPAYSDYPGGQTVYYSTRPEGPRLYDLLGTLPLAQYGALTWVVLDAEAEILDVPDVPDEQKVMQALWARWIFSHRLDFVKNYEAGARMFIDEHWRMIHKAAGWAALRNLLLVLYMNRFLKMNEVAMLLRHYQELVQWDLWYEE
ncbi:hypothetical protein HDZ31DRAFT_28888 [Schizophyllum fasciatum]